MEPPQRSSHNLFEVYLRLRPAPPGTPLGAERILTVEPDEEGHNVASHITLNPPTDRRRAIEKFGFTKVFAEHASQLNVFHSTEVVPLVEGVIAPQGGEGTDAMVATLGVTGSGKTHTILGSKSQRGLTQLALDVLFRSVSPNLLESHEILSATESLQACDPSESVLIPASHFLDAFSGDSQTRSVSRAATPMIGESLMSPTPRRNLHRPSALPQSPDVSTISVPCDPSAEYAVVVSMYEVHNDRIYDLLTPPSKATNSKDPRRRPLLFKSTELSPDRKVVAGLRKVICGSFRDAIMVLEAGLQERRVAGTGSNSTSSRSHGFFCFEVRKRSRRSEPWEGSRLTIVDLAGSERARDAKTAGATLVEAGKINESLMYLGQCLQTQSEAATSAKPNIVPYRQCKLTELLFSNSFPSSSTTSAQTYGSRRNPQRGVMIVTADPLGDFNATSQILRYSALAREVTVPRIPSITATILATTPNVRPPSPIQHQQHPRPFLPPGATGGGYRTVSSDERATMELAALEIARLSDDIDNLRAELDQESDARVTAEAHLLSMEDRMLDMEAAIREDCAHEFEQRLALELARFKASLAMEQERQDEHWDRKVDVLERGLEDNDENYDKENILIENLEEEVERLRRDNAIMKRELTNRSPSKRKPLEERDDYRTASPSPASSPSKASFPRHQLSSSPTKHEGIAQLGRKMERMRVSNSSSAASSRPASGSVSPVKRVRKLGGKRWEDDDELN